MDLQYESGQILIGIVSPLTMRYTLIEKRRLVFVGALTVLLARPWKSENPES